VHVAHANEEWVVLLTDPTQLASGDRIVVSPLPVIVDGMEIRLDDRATRTTLEEGETDSL